MSKRISPDYCPSERVYSLMAARFGITPEAAREFIGHELGDFLLYWEGRTGAGAAKQNWDSTCLNWMKRAYEDRKESMAQNRTFGKAKENVFQEVAAEMIADGMAKPESLARRPLKIDHKPIPGDGETMSVEDALAQLAQIGGRNG